MLDGAAAPPKPAGATPRVLSPAAQKIAEQTIAVAYSPIVLAGTVRLIEFALVMLVGLVIYFAYAFPMHGFEWQYPPAIAAIALIATLAFQAADIYQVQAFRGYEKQYFRLASAWSVVFLVVIGISFFAKAGEQFSRVWLGTYYIVGLIVLIVFRRALFLMVRRWTQQGRLDRRTVIVGADEKGAALINSLLAQRNSDLRIIGAFDDRNDDRSPDGGGRAAQARPGRRPDRIRAADARRPRDRLDAALGARSACSKC